VGSLQGGDVQLAVTSGGETNAVSRVVTGLTLGQFQITATIEQPARDGGDYPNILAAAFRAELARTATQLELDAKGLPVENGTVAADAVIAILDRTEQDLRRSLPYPEFAALHASVSDLFAQTRQELLGDGEQRASAFILVAAKRINAGHARRALESRATLFRERSATSPVHELCVVTTPEQHATVSFVPAAFRSDPAPSIDTNSRITLYLGKYVYSVTKTGFATINSVIDLFTQPYQVLDCTLPHVSKQDYGCGHPDEPVERCP
jgi:hypothetical protein